VSSLAVVIVTYDAAPQLAGLARALTPELRPGDEVVVVDNASRDGTAEAAGELGAPFTVIECATNRGYGAGCAAGAAATRAPLLLFLNPDARPRPGALARLRAVAGEQAAWAAWQPAVMLPDGRINTAGGVAHFLGFGWAGRCGQPAEALPEGPCEVAFASGAALVIRREVWEELGGFDESYFLYGEDLELGLRLWLSGHAVGIEPRALVVHDYEFDKGPRKWFLLERNRWRTIIALYPASLLALLGPALLAFELALLAVAARGGWLRAKLRADLAVPVGLGVALRRRAAVRQCRRIDAAAFAGRLSASLDSPYLGRIPRILTIAQAAYFALVRGTLRLTSRAPVSIARSAGGSRSGRPQA
jgi:GT2 family glycosyltransferase